MHILKTATLSLVATAIAAAPALAQHKKQTNQHKQMLDEIRAIIREEVQNAMQKQGKRDTKKKAGGPRRIMFAGPMKDAKSDNLDSLKKRIAGLKKRIAASKKKGAHKHSHGPDLAQLMDVTEGHEIHLDGSKFEEIQEEIAKHLHKGKHGAFSFKLGEGGKDNPFAKIFKGKKGMAFAPHWISMGKKGNFSLSTGHNHPQMDATSDGKGNFFFESGHGLNNSGCPHCQSHSSANSNSHGKSHGSAHGNSHGKSHGSAHGNSHGKSHGSAHGNSHGNSGCPHSQGQGNAHGKVMQRVMVSDGSATPHQVFEVRTGPSQNAQIEYLFVGPDGKQHKSWTKSFKKSKKSVLSFGGGKAFFTAKGKKSKASKSSSCCGCCKCDKTASHASKGMTNTFMVQGQPLKVNQVLEWAAPSAVSGKSNKSLSLKMLGTSHNQRALLKDIKVFTHQKGLKHIKVKASKAEGCCPAGAPKAPKAPKGRIMI